MDVDHPKPAKSFDHPKKRNLCCGLILFLIGIVLLIVILGFTIFKPKHTITTVNSIKLDGLKVSLDVPRLGVDLNITLILNLSVKNPNKAGFKYGNGSTLLYYRGNVIGEAGIPGGEVSPGETIEVITSLTVLADRLISNSNLYSDVISGNLSVTTYTKISGRVSVLKIFKHHLVSYTTCDISLDVYNRMVKKSECKYKTKL